MDYKVFYEDVVDWINQANQAAARFGMSNSEFWQWVAESSGALCLKYQDNRLVVKQMAMMVEWLEEVYESRQTA
ncbi:hypothetical protein BVG16_15770 [Paenibacillus selenitireducens]|uniref:Uncharacterized protein n=1 Tax=Paenibacillus selenitireducens TaxID=1324314 RepID=A0A1T2X9W9_9BACL|nr:hypothetical protein [Paenibacillus selenitireducens]OPA76638.1 hypothetical protein BVG16_15770 [Paenibacillus selenitireducens]